jgi:hypothetical protein
MLLSGMRPSLDCGRDAAEAGLISYVRGKITLLDRPGLEEAACERYGVIADEYASLRPY